MSRKEQVAKLIQDNVANFLDVVLGGNDTPYLSPMGLADQIDALYKADITRLKEALTEISKGMGRYSQDPLTHASNTIDDMKRLALDTLLQQDKDCSGCEYKHVCKDDPQKPDYCPKGD
jgi:hypothetical protein